MTKNDKFKQDFKEWRKKCDKFEECLDKTDSDMATEFAQLMLDSPYCPFLFAARDVLDQADISIQQIVDAASLATQNIQEARGQVQEAIDALGCENGGS